jgi:putative peptidoglycan lipid II flippase
LALSTSAVAMFGFVVLFVILRARLGGVYGRELVAGFAKVALASAAMGGAVFLASRQMERWLGVSQMAHRADLAVSMPLGVAVFYAACRAMGVTDLDMALQAVLAPLRRRLGRKRP